MGRFFSMLLCSLALGCAALAHSSDADDGFIWLDANTKIQLKPIGKAGSAALGGSAAPASKKEETEKAKK